MGRECSNSEAQSETSKHWELEGVHYTSVKYITVHSNTLLQYNTLRCSWTEM